MKTVVLHLEDDKYEKLKQVKADKTWNEFVDQLIE